MPCIGGLVLAVATANKQKFIDHGGRGDPVYTGYGAIRVPECRGDDVKDGKQTDFRRAMQATDDGTIVRAGLQTT